MFVMVVLLVLMVGFVVFFECMLFGKVLWVIVVNWLGVWLVGIWFEFVGLFVFMVVVLMGVLSGLFIGFKFFIGYDIGFFIGFKGFVGVIIGGLVFFLLVVIGVLLVGFIESYVSFSFS